MLPDKILKIASYFYSLATDDIKSSLDSLESFKDRIELAEKKLKHLSSGSSRIVFLTSRGTVIKLAKNKKGLAQNKAESNPKMKSKFLNKILDKSPKHFWLEVNFIDKINPDQFKKILGFDFEDFKKTLRFLIGKNKSKPNKFNKIKELDLVKDMVRLCEDFDLVSGDIVRISSWGEKDGNLILIDSGLTRKIYETYYDSNSSSSS